MIFGGFLFKILVCVCLFVLPILIAIKPELIGSFALSRLESKHCETRAFYWCEVRKRYRRWKPPSFFSRSVPISPTAQSPDSSQGVEAGRHLSTGYRELAVPLKPGQLK